MTDTRHAPLTTTHGLPVTARSVDVLDPSTGEVRSDSADGIACWFVDSDYNMESFFVRHANFLGANDPYTSPEFSTASGRWSASPESWASSPST